MADDFRPFRAWGCPSALADLLETYSQEWFTTAEIVARLGDMWNPRAVTRALYRLRERGWVTSRHVDSTVSKWVPKLGKHVEYLESHSEWRWGGGVTMWDGDRLVDVKGGRG